MERIVECVPNFSEGRKAETVERLVEAVESAGALVLDTHMDPDHNRSVITFVAEPERIVEAAVRAVKLAAELIDLREHTGQHPRVGATDVLPFVPVRGVTMEDCVKLAHEAGARIASEAGIPVYFYEAAARRPERVNLEDVRRGGFEVLREEIGRVAARVPDVGEPRLHDKGGACIVGARPFLLAYNINLRTDDLTVARRVASAVRGRNGGLRYLKALGFQLAARGMAQVSMNLTRHDLTKLHHAFEAVRREAERWGVGVAGSEIVGLVPQSALDMSAEYFLRIENFSTDLVLENRIAAALKRRDEMTAQKRLEFVETTDSSSQHATVSSSVSSGGEAAGQAASLAAALGEMVARLIEGQKRFRNVEQNVRDAVQELRMLRAQLADSAHEDAASFSRVIAARNLPKATDEERRTRANEVEAALKGATAVPLEVANVAVQVSELLETLAELGDPKWLSDSAAGAQLALAAVRAARYTVLVNTAEIDDEEFVEEHRSRVDDLLDRAHRVAGSIEAMLMESLG